MTAHAEIKLGPREQQIADLVLQGYGTEEMAAELKIKRRTVKAHLARLFMRFGIRSGIKRVKLATLLYRRHQCEKSTTTTTILGENLHTSNGASSSGWPQA